MADWLKILKEYVDALESAIGNPTGVMSAVTQSEDLSLAAYLINAREMYRAHDQTRICLIVPDLANLASDAPNTAIKAELDKIGSCSVLDQASVDGGVECWGFYDLIVVGSDTYAVFVNANLDDLILTKIPIMVCNSAVADHLKMGTDTTQSANTVNEWCQTIGNRMMYLIFGSTGDKAIFSEAALSDRLDMSDASLTDHLLMTSLTGDTNTTTVVGSLPMESGEGVLYTLDDDTEMPGGRLFAGCFVNADKLTELGKLLLRRVARNFTQISLTPTITLQAQAQTVAAILVDTSTTIPGTITALQATADAIEAITDALPDAGALTTLQAAVDAIPTGPALVSDGWDAALATILDNFSAGRIGYLDQLDFNLAEAIAAIPTGPALVSDGWDAALATILDNFTALRIGYLEELDFDLAGAIAAIPTGPALVSDGWDAALATILDNFTALRIGYLEELDFDLAAAIGAITTGGPTNTQLNTAIALCAQVADGWDAALATILDNFTAGRIGYLDQLDFNLAEAIALCAQTADGWDATLAGILDNFTAARIGYLDNIDTKAMGRSQIFEKSITSPADTGDVLVATITDQPCQIESVIIHADTAQPAHMTSCGVFGGNAKIITFIAAADALEADLDAIDKQVYWEGKVRLAATKTIVISLVGTGADNVDLTIVVKYRASVSGGYLN